MCRTLTGSQSRPSREDNQAPGSGEASPVAPLPQRTAAHSGAARRQLLLALGSGPQPRRSMGLPRISLDRQQARLEGHSSWIIDPDALVGCPAREQMHEWLRGPPSGASSGAGVTDVGCHGAGGGLASCRSGWTLLCLSCRMGRSGVSCGLIEPALGGLCIRAGISCAPLWTAVVFVSAQDRCAAGRALQ